MRSRLRVTLRSSDWRKLSTLLSRPAVAVELPREVEGVERAVDLRREAPPDLVVRREVPPDLAVLCERAALFDFELRLAVVFLAVEDFERVLLAPELFALAPLERLLAPALLLVDPLRPVLFEPLLPPDFFVAIGSSSVVPLMARTISSGGLEGGLNW
jgi:hypothetical protein